MERIKVDDLIIEVRRSARRKSIDLTVDRGGDIVIAVPKSISNTEILKTIKNKLVWLHTTLERKRETRSELPPREFVSGEGFYYLGRKYRLQLCPPGKGTTPKQTILLTNGRFLLHRDFIDKAQKLFVSWYTQKARDWILPKVETLKLRIDASPTNVAIRDLGFRWGSCTNTGKVYFHWRTILLPPERIEYLILHELVHLHEHNHSPGFYQRLERACPNYTRHESWLSRNGDKYTL